jgi:hypothetical protein
VRGLRGGGRSGWCEEGQERLGPSYFFIPLVLGPLNSLVWWEVPLGYIVLGYCIGHRRETAPRARPAGLKGASVGRGLRCQVSVLQYKEAAVRILPW